MTIGDSRCIKRLVSKIIYSCELWQLTFLYGGSTLKNGQYSRDYDQNQCVLTGSIWHLD